MKSVGLLLALLPWAASAATITVNSRQDNSIAADGLCTLREAIANVNAAAETTGGDCPAGSGSGDTITFSGRTTIRLALGELAIRRDVTILGSLTTVRIGAGHQTRVFEILAGMTQMSGVTIQSGMADHGGGVLVDGGTTLTLSNCTLRSNTATASGGGGVYNDGGTVTLSNCKLTGNKARTAAGDGRGGAIYNPHGSVSLSACTLTRNTAYGGDGGAGFGGAIQNGSAGSTDADLEITGSAFNSNKAVGGGGAIENVGSATLSGSSFKRNLTRPGNGGGIENSGTATVSSCTFERNQARSGNGGGIENGGTVNVTDSNFDRNLARSGFGGGLENDGNATTTNCIFSGNRAGIKGGGLDNGGVEGSAMAALTNTTVNGNYAGIDGGGLSNFGTVNLINSTISGNLADGNIAGVGGGGGGIYNDGPCKLINCTISGNRARRSGGGIFNVNSEGPEAVLSLTNCTVSGNHAGARYSGGGLLGYANFTNTIVADNDAGDRPNCAGGGSTGGHNLSSDDACFGLPTDLHTEPRLAPLGNYGGLTQTVALCTDVGVPHSSCTGASPAIDAGDDAVTGPPDNLSTDQRGLPRLSGAHVDIGAYEVQQ